MDEDKNLEIGSKHLWLDDNNNNRNYDSLVDAATIFCNDDSPFLPDIPCMSSSSSSPSTPAAVKPSTPTSSSSSAESSSPLVGNAAAAASEIPPPLDNDSINDMMENLKFLLDCNEIWGPSSISQTENQPAAPLEDQHATSAAAPPPTAEVVPEESNGFGSFLEDDNRELSVIFFEWWRRNKSDVSVEDVRSIKVKNSIIENATQRLGTDSEGKKKLLIFILEWAKRHKKSLNPNPNPNPSPNIICNPMSPEPIACCYPASPLGRYLSPMAHQAVKGTPYQISQRVGNAAQSWAVSPMMQSKYSRSPDNGNVMNHQPVVYRNPYHPNGKHLVRLGPVATKEARRKRIKIRRRRKLNSKHRGVKDGGEDGDGLAGGGSNSEKNVNVVAEDVPIPLKWSASDRPEQQVWKNMMFLMKKMLKQSDVSSLGRIVLPKKVAESYLPKLETRDWITIPIEDIGNSRVWNMRYRYWNNNKSRMYLLENTGDFVKLNGLREGDFIFLYMDKECGKYMIRGFKVPESEKKLVIKKPRKRNVRKSSLAGNSSSHDPNKKAKI